MQVDMLGVFHNCPLFFHFQVAMRDLHCDGLQADCPLLKGANCGDWHYVLRYIIYCWVTASAICATASPGLFLEPVHGNMFHKQLCKSILVLHWKATPP